MFKYQLLIVDYEQSLKGKFCTYKRSRYAAIMNLSPIKEAAMHI